MFKTDEDGFLVLDESYLVIDLSDELYKDELVWFDPYLGRSKINDTKVAISYVSDDNMIVLVDDGKSIKEENVDGLRECILCEDCDESRMLASHISFRR